MRSSFWLMIRNEPVVTQYLKNCHRLVNTQHQGLIVSNWNTFTSFPTEDKILPPQYARTRCISIAIGYKCKGKEIVPPLPDITGHDCSLKFPGSKFFIFYLSWCFLIGVLALIFAPRSLLLFSLSSPRTTGSSCLHYVHFSQHWQYTVVSNDQ